jgi:hypothetical protein
MAHDEGLRGLREPAASLRRAALAMAVSGEWRFVVAATAGPLDRPPGQVCESGTDSDRT